MKTERGLFEEWFPLKHLFNYLYWSEEQKNYVYNQYDEEHCRAYEYINSSWSAWCASAQRDGYKLVPVETLEECLSWACCASSESWNDEQRDEIDKHYKVIEKAMIGVAE